MIATLVLIVLMITGFNKLSSENDRLQTVGTAVCNLRAEQANRVHETVDFLRGHPRGIPGVPIGSLRLSLYNEERTLQALKPLRCN